MTLSMRKWEVFEEKVRQAARELMILKREREKFLADIQLYQNELERTQKLRQENNLLKDEKRRVKERMDKLYMKLSNLT